MDLKKGTGKGWEQTHLNVELFPINHFLGTFRKIATVRLPSDFISHFDRQIFDFQECLSFSERSSFFFPELFDKAANLFSKPVLHDLFPKPAPDSGNPNNFTRPTASQIRGQSQSAECTSRGSDYETLLLAQFAFTR